MTSEFECLPYRPCVGIMLLNHDNKIFVGKRIDTVIEAWQMPQGGIDPGEAASATALRELKEEVGTNNAEIIAESKNWLSYDLPEHLIGVAWKGKYRGQRMKWFAVRFLGEDKDIDLQAYHPEFSEWSWQTSTEIMRLIVPFKRDLYDKVFTEFAHLGVK